MPHVTHYSLQPPIVVPTQDVLGIPFHSEYETGNSPLTKAMYSGKHFEKNKTRKRRLKSLRVLCSGTEGNI